MAGDRETGVTIHRDREGARRRADRGAGGVSIGRRRRRCRRRVRPLGRARGELLEGVLAEDEPRFEPQPEEGVTYADKITAADRELDLADPEQAVRVVRALSPHIGARATSTAAT